jgi:hypothetical protein
MTEAYRDPQDNYRHINTPDADWRASLLPYPVSIRDMPPSQNGWTCAI